MLVVNSPRPISGKGVLQGFWLSNPIEWLSLDLLDKRINSFEYLFIGFLPVQVVFPCILGKN